LHQGGIEMSNHGVYDQSGFSSPIASAGVAGDEVGGHGIVESGEVPCVHPGSNTNSD